MHHTIKCDTCSYFTCHFLSSFPPSPPLSFPCKSSVSVAYLSLFFLTHSLTSKKLTFRLLSSQAINKLLTKHCTAHGINSIFFSPNQIVHRCFIFIVHMNCCDLRANNNAKREKRKHITFFLIAENVSVVSLYSSYVSIIPNALNAAAQFTCFSWLFLLLLCVHFAFISIHNLKL